ncbi:hypothetical protein [Conchiformibius steedae]|uniref:hypothetical protein n=1 Tax=Conchiformibius steedae TaxID=153493 RepID=UPI0026F27DE2|nr:hypothetical protein [Conchiformibius steedae]
MTIPIPNTPHRQTFPLPPKAQHFKDKQEAEREYTREFLRLAEMSAYMPPTPPEVETHIQRFLIANTERIVQIDEKTFELRGMHDARITEVRNHFPNFALAFLHFIFGDYPLPPIEYIEKNKKEKVDAPLN